MSKIEYYLISDIHLERKNEYKKKFLLESINLVIENNKQSGKETVIVFSGDVDNGTNAYNWLKQIDAQIIYTAGNHEFWNNDYYETLENLQKDIPANVKFLHNDFVECADYLFVGSTMWTDVGKTLNDDLKYVSNGIMNDNINITAKQWYNNKNTERLKSISNHYGFEKSIEKKGWNILIEQEENQKTIQFFKDFASVRNQMLKLRENYLTSDKQLVSKYSPMPQDKYDALHKAMDMENYSYKQWLLICREFNLLGYEEVSEKMINNVSLESEVIFKKLRTMNYQKDIVIVSHHLPFLEERLVGYYSHIRKSEKLLNTKADSPIYSIKNGLNTYPQHNYFYRINKGEFSRDESILEAIHYNNNGAVNLPEYIFNDVKAWCHGHDHTLNYQDYVKGIPIVTNPLSYSLDVFLFSEKGIHLNDGYKRYHKIETEEQEQAEVDELRTLVLKPIEFNQLNNTKELLKLWVFSLMDYDKIYNLLESFTQNNKKAFTYLAKNPQFSVEEMSDKQYAKLQEFLFANYYYYGELEKELDKLDIGYAVRKDNEFSYMTKVNKIYSKEITEHFLGEGRYEIRVDMHSKEIIQDYGYEHLTSQFFKNIYHLNKAMKRIKHLKPILVNYEEIKSVTELFNKEVPELYPKEPRNDYLFSHELETKKRKILDKYLTQEIKDLKEKQYRERFNF